MNYMFCRRRIRKELCNYQTKLLERKYSEGNFNKQMENVDLTEQKELLQNEEKNKHTSNISELLGKYWPILQINSEFCNVFNKATPT